MPIESIQPEQLLETLRSLPWAAHAIAAGVLINGLLLWIYGRKLLKPMIVAAFTLAGAAAGYVLPAMTAVADSISVNVGLGVGAVIGAVLGLVLFRFAMAVSLGIVLAAMAPVLCVVIAGVPGDETGGSLSKEEMLLRGVPEESDRDGALARELAARGEKLRGSLSDAVNAATQSGQENQNAAPESDRAGASASDQFIRTAAQRVKAFAVALRAELAAQWDELPGRMKIMIAGSASVGLGVGIILGLLLPKWTSGAVTAMLGAAVWMPALTWLLAAAGTSIAERWHPSATHWLIAWAGVSGLGTLIQWRGIRGSKKTKGQAATVIVKQG